MPGKGRTKAQRRILRDLAGLAHKRELEKALGKLEAQFRARREGHIDSFALNDRVHEFHDGASRDLWNTYVNLDAATLGSRNPGVRSLRFPFPASLECAPIN